MNATRKLFALLGALVVAAPSFADAQLVPVAPSTVSGPLSIVWGDPATPGDKPEVRSFVFDQASRRSYEVKIDSVLAAKYGGLVAMNRTQVTVKLDRPGTVGASHANYLIQVPS